jgi:hypothetical protein
MERDAIETNVKFIKEIDEFNDYIDSRLPIELRENQQLLKTLESTKEKLQLAREHFLLDFSHMSKSKEDFEEDCSNSNYSQDRISWNGKNLITSTDKIILDVNQFISLAIKSLIDSLECIEIRKKEAVVEKVMEEQQKQPVAKIPDIFEQQELAKSDEEKIKEGLAKFGVTL